MLSAHRTRRVSSYPKRGGGREAGGRHIGDAAPTSLIDVVFLLLIFFMCATRFRIPGADLDSFLPRDRGHSDVVADSTLHPCVVRLARADGRIRCMADDRELPQGAIEWLERTTGVPGPDLGALISHMRARQELSAHPLRVVIDASPDVPAKYVVGVVNSCTKLQIDDVALVEQELSID